MEKIDRRWEVNSLSKLAGGRRSGGSPELAGGRMEVVDGGEDYQGERRRDSQK